MLTVGLEAKDFFNANAGQGFKEAGNNETEITLVGFGIKEDEKVNEETGEVKAEEIVVMKADNGELYSGNSGVLLKRVKEMSELWTEEEVKSGIPIQFRNIKAGRGVAVTFIVK